MPLASRALRFAYRLQEASDDERRPAFYAYVVGKTGYLQIAIYFDNEDQLATAMAIWRTATEASVR